MNIEQASADELRSLAHGAAAQLDFTTAAAILGRVVQLEPRSARDWHHLGTLLYKAENSERASECFRKALTLEPRHAQWRQEYAVSLTPLGRFAQAIAQHRKAIADGVPNPAVSWVEIANIHERMRKPDLARKAFEKATELDPRNARAFEGLGRLEMGAGNLDAAERLYERGLSATSDPLDKATILHRIGALREKQEDWDAAFKAHRQANVFLSRSPEARNALRAPLPSGSEYLGEDAAAHYERWGAQTINDGLPTPSFLVGFPRSGTTMTEQALAALPNVCTTDEHLFMNPVYERLPALLSRGSGEDESLSFIERLDGCPASRLSELRMAYWNGVWKVVGGEVRESGKRVVDKQPTRILDAGMINRLFPGAKMIVMLRDPRDCCISAFFQNLGITPISVRFLTLESLGDLYAHIMGFWVEIRNKLTIDWLEVRYEDLVADFEPNARKIVEFLGEPWDPRVLEFHKKAAKRAIGTPSYEAVTQKVNTRAVGKWAKYEKHIGPLVERVRPFLETFGYEE